MFAIVLVALHVCAVYAAIHIAGIEYADIWRAATVALLSYVVMFVVGLLLIPLAFVPILNQVLGLLILGLGTAFAAKMVLACDWQPAWVIGGAAAVIHALADFIFSGCTHI